MTALELVKSKFATRESLILMIDDARAERMLVAWTLYHPKFHDFVVPNKFDADEIRDRLWRELAPIDYARLGDMLEIPESRARRTFERLRAANLVWPDGSILDSALTILRSRANNILRALLPKDYDNQKPRTSEIGDRVHEPTSQGIPKGRVAESASSAGRRAKAGKHRLATR